MSIESASAFYQKLSTDEAFAKQLRNAPSEDECRATIRAAGYDFTPEEWGRVVDQIKQSNDREVSESELEAVSGGVISRGVISGGGTLQALYGVISPSGVDYT